MKRPPPENAADLRHATPAEYEEAAALAARIVALHPNSASPPGPFVHPRQAALPIHGWGFWILYVFAWLATLILFAIAGLRIWYHDGTHILTWINAFTRYVYLPAYVCLAWATWKRRWILALANAAVICLHIAWIAPDFVRDHRFDPAISQSVKSAISSPRVRIFFANVNGYNREFDSLFREIQVADPDVIILVEFAVSWSNAVSKSPLFAKYPYGNGRRDARLGQVNIFSRLPLKNEMEEWIYGRNIRTFEIPLGTDTLRVVGLHAPRPAHIQNDNYESYWTQMVPKLLAEKGPLVIVGDCNATQYSLVYKQLTDYRLRSAHEDRGRGYATSWPNGYFLLPPIRIDQAFLSPEVECLGVTEGEGLGSDHKPIILDVQVRANR